MFDSKAHAAIDHAILFHMDPSLRNSVLEMWRFMVPNRSSYLLTKTTLQKKKTTFLKDLISILREALETILLDLHKL